MTITKSTTQYYASSVSGLSHKKTINIPESSLLVIRAACRGSTGTPSYLNFSYLYSDIPLLNPPDDPTGGEISLSEVYGTTATYTPSYMRTGMFYAQNLKAGYYYFTVSIQQTSSLVFYATWFTGGTAVIKNWSGNNISVSYPSGTGYVIPISPISEGGCGLDFWSTSVNLTWQTVRLSMVQEYNETVGNGTKVMRAGCAYDLSAPDNDMGWGVSGGTYDALGSAISIEESFNSNTFFPFFK